MHAKMSGLVTRRRRFALTIALYLLCFHHVRWSVLSEEEIVKNETNAAGRAIEYDDVERGSVVVRGPDWKWGKQDGGRGERGVVVDILRWAGESDPGKYAVRVRWDATSFENNYRYGAENARDIRIIGRRSDWETSESNKPTHTLSILERNDVDTTKSVAGFARKRSRNSTQVCAESRQDDSACSKGEERMSRQRSAMLDIWRDTTIPKTVLMNGKTPSSSRRKKTQWISAKRWRRTGRANPCEDRWEGVVCDPDMEVVALDLSNNNLVGTLPSSLVHLSSLRSLTLANNRKLSGRIPADGLERVAHLRFFAAHNDALEGPLPTQIGSLRELEWLSLYNNRLTGTIPSELGNCDAMHSMFLQTNRLTGKLPASLGKLKNLKVLSLHHNDLTGFVPHSVAFLELTRFSVVGTKLRFSSTIETSSSIFNAGKSPFRRKILHDDNDDDEGESEDDHEDDPETQEDTGDESNEAETTGEETSPSGEF